MSYPTDQDFQMARERREPPRRQLDAAALNKLDAVLVEIREERRRQHAKWGEQNHPDGTGPGAPLAEFIMSADAAKARCDNAFKRGTGTYAEILHEEFCEAIAEGDKAKLRAELVQVAAVAVAWIEKLDRVSP